MALSKQAKILIIVAIISATYLYSKKTKDFYDQLTRVEEPLLTTLPDFKIKNIKSGENITSHSVLKEGNSGLFVHFWGTWCAPCEAELPEFLKFARSFEGNTVKFLLVAVNDKEADLGKFLKKFGSIPQNVTIALDRDGTSMDYFGSSKVPETYLFNKEKNFVTRFIGPQDWQASQFIEQTKKNLSI